MSLPTPAPTRRTLLESWNNLSGPGKIVATLVAAWLGAMVLFMIVWLIGVVLLLLPFVLIFLGSAVLVIIQAIAAQNVGLTDVMAALLNAGLLA